MPTRITRNAGGVLLVGLSLGLARTGAADPCGMVPPVWVPDATVAIQRIGVQKTYAFFKDGIETLAIRPGFQGSVDEFGMLVPLPAVPAIRKISDATFPHLTAAVDPPKMTVHIYDPEKRRMYSRSKMVESAASMDFDDEMAEEPLRFDEVRVLKQEAVGMYEVAVLGAGSAAALKRWMDEHEYRYPDGMDAVVSDYVAQKWCFVAVKAKVGQLPGVAPKPGMRGVDPKLPSGASFSGHVQGMAFRFAVDEPVIPMRLSTFNGDDTHNLVYLLSEAPVRVDGVPEDLVVRQVTGRELFANVVDPLDLEITGGAPSEIPERFRQQINQLRDPAQYNGVAKATFAADLLAVRTETLSLPFEEREKELLNISEGFGMRGPAVDALHQRMVGEEADRASRIALDDLREMTLTVFDGEFPRAHLRDQNLTFARYNMPRAKNSPDVYNRRPPGPSLSVPRERGGTIPTGPGWDWE